MHEKIFWMHGIIFWIPSKNNFYILLAGVPDVPSNVNVDSNGILTWSEPKNNGQPIEQYNINLYL